MKLLTIPSSVLRQGLAELARRPEQVLRLPAGECLSETCCEVLIAAPGHTFGPCALLSMAAEPPSSVELLPDCAARLTFGRGPWRGVAWGHVRGRSGAEPARLLRVVGPGLHALALGTSAGVADAEKPVVAERWSRTIGALGLSEWTRLTTLRVGVIGAGRTGSALAFLLAGLGVRHLTLIDADHLESHNLGETVPWAGLAMRVGEPKVDGLAEMLMSTADPPPSVRPVVASITRLRGLRAAQACDVLFSCVDSDAARWAASAVQSLFLRPLIDVAAGIHGRAEARELGTDVRLVLPGRCLRCLGGFRSGAAVPDELLSADAERSARAARVWHQERAGSLASLNQLAASVAVRLLEDLVGERVQDSTWVRLTFDSAGRLKTSYPPTARRPGPASCPICALSGTGDAGVPLVPQALQQDVGSDREGAQE